MIELKAIIYLVNGRYHFAQFMPGVIGNLPQGEIITEEQISWSNLLDALFFQGLETRMRAAVRKDATSRGIKNPKIYVLDKDLY